MVIKKENMKLSGLRLHQVLSVNRQEGLVHVINGKNFIIKRGKKDNIIRYGLLTEDEPITKAKSTNQPDTYEFKGTQEWIHLNDPEYVNYNQALAKYDL